MRALIVYAPPEPTSFTAALKDAAVAALEAAGHDVKGSDLYGERFNPTGGRQDFTTVADPARFHYQTEQRHAAAHEGFSMELRREQQRVEEADLILFVFPLRWGSVPAILKGWFERVLAYGFAYEDGIRYETGFLRGRVGLMGLVTGGTTQRFSSEGSYGTIAQVLWPTQHCMIEHLELTTMEPFVAYAAPRIGQDARRALLGQWRAQVDEAMAVAKATATNGGQPSGPTRVVCHVLVKLDRICAQS